LEVSNTATAREIKKSYHRLARKYHPDNRATGDKEKIREINEAFDVLRDPRSKAKYDQ